MSNPDRRQFMKTSSKTVAGVTLASAIGAGVSSKAEAAESVVLKGRVLKSLKMGMVKVKGSLEDKFKAVQDLGFDGIELNSPGGVNKDEALKASQKTGLPIHGVVDSKHWSVRMTDKNPETRLAARKDLETALRDSHKVGGSAALLVPGRGGDGTKAETVARAQEQIRGALPLAAKLGQHILIENVWNQMFYDHGGKADQTADELKDFIDSFNSPWVGSYFDIGNHQKYGDPAKWIRTLGKRIVKLDVKGFHRGQNKFTKIGDGDIDWADVRKAIHEIGFTGWCTAEVGGGDEKRLKEISERLDKYMLGL